ncbi:restriction endonuclease type II-like protein, partial [Russula dissimulans]
SSTTDSKGKERQPPVVQPGSGNSIIINPCQRLNPIVECIRNVPKEFADILPDYQVGRTTGVLFLSLRYHRLHPEYIHQRIERLGQSYNLRILLLMCDISEHQDPIRELTRVCLLNNITVIVAWSADEAAQYLTAYKQSEHRAPTLIRERVDKTPGALLRTALTSIPRVNKTDVETLRTSFGSFARIAQADAAQLARLPGFGPKKVVRLKDAFERPFRTGTTSALANPSATASASVSALPPTDPSSSTTTTTSSAPTTAQHPSSSSSSSSRTKAGNASKSTGERAPAPDSMWDIDLDLNSPSPPP